MFDFVAVSGRMDDRVIEFVDHLHEHLVHPVSIRRGRYLTVGARLAVRKSERLGVEFAPRRPVWVR
jgi:L-fuconate dehydratase